MRQLTPTHRLHGYSLPEITRAWEGLVFELERSLEFNGRKLKPGPALSAVMLHFLGLEPDTQRRVMAAGLRRLEEMMARDEPGAPGPPAPPPDPAPAPAPVKVRHIKGKPGAGSGAKSVRRKELP